MKKFIKYLLLLSSTLFSANIFVSTTGNSGDGSEGNPYGAIKTGINAAVNGDQVILEDGTYHEHNIHFFVKAITVGSRFLLDGDNSI